MSHRPGLSDTLLGLALLKTSVSDGGKVLLLSKMSWDLSSKLKNQDLLRRTLTGDTMTRFLGNPGLVDRCAGKYHSQQIGKKVAEDEGHDCPSHISEVFTHTKEAEKEKKNGEFV